MATYSAVANRQALQLDYYSRKKIIVTPPNYVRNCRLPPRQRAHLGIAGKTPRRKNILPRNHARNFRRNAKVPMEYGFWPHPWAQLYLLACARRTSRASRSARAMKP